MTATLSEHVTIREAARRLDMHPHTIRRRIKSGELEAVRLGDDGPLRIPVDALAALLQPASSAARPPLLSRSRIPKRAALDADHEEAA